MVHNTKSMMRYESDGFSIYLQIHICCDYDTIRKILFPVSLLVQHAFLSLMVVIVTVQVCCCVTIFLAVILFQSDLPWLENLPFQTDILLVNAIRTTDRAFTFWFQYDMNHIVCMLRTCTDTFFMFTRTPKKWK